MSIAIGLVGTGYWAQEVHAPSLAATPDIDFVGVWGRNAADRDQLARTAGVRSFASYDELLAAVDGVSFAVPPDVQQPMAVRAAGEHKHLLLEKPIGLDRAEAAEVADAVAAGGVSAVVFTTRLFDTDRAGWLRDVRLRAWSQAQVEMLSDALIPGGPYDDSRWRHERGAVWDLGPHVLSQLVPVLGPVTEVALDFWERDGETRLRLRHQAGAESAVHLTLHGAAEDAVEWIEFRDGQGDAVRSPAGSLDFTGCHGRALATLVAQVGGTAGGDVLADLGYSAAAGAQAVRVIDAVQQLIDDGRLGELVPVGAAG